MLRRPQCIITMVINRPQKWQGILGNSNKVNGYSTPRIVVTSGHPAHARAKKYMLCDAGPCRITEKDEKGKKEKGKENKGKDKVTKRIHSSKEIDIARDKQQM